jgi:universal stress protein A
MENGYQRILIAIDGSDDADQVLDAATGMQPKGDDVFDVVTVIPPLLDGMGGMSGASFSAAWPLKDMEAVLTREITETVRERVARHGILPDRVTVLFGRPATEILARAEQLGAELIVIGSHGRHALARMILGSTANGVLHGASCDVLVVRILA